MTPTTTAQRSPQPLYGDVSVDPTVLLSLSALRARKRLHEAPGLVAYVRTLMVPAGAQRSDGQPRGGSKEPPAPFRIDAVDESDSVYAQLLNWIGYWSVELVIPAPVTATYAWSNEREVQGFRAGTTAEGAGILVQNLTTWLLLHQDKILRHQQAGEYFTDVSQIIRDLHGKFPRTSRGMRPVLPRPCPLCDEPEMGVDWSSDQLDDFTLTCNHCGYQGDTAALLRDRDVRRILGDMRVEYAPEPSEWWTKKQAVSELRITPQTLNRYIQQDHLPTQTADGTVYVNADDLRGLWRQKRIRDKEHRAEKSTT
ncbi:hypothetical protein NYQ35_16005 [Curtobacterium flaccumfaciens pv. flaccumfaciens]|uniref:hypothetical protein n=1 Tax=Curtobacterium flaccumfaciens TaxID=2035 RepID=UPI00217DF7B5|nr:hypothetical protein [Curtobacterium flaccumfaciens]MCS6570310.1 hypothetical protein [Curtobacterium flaccumfaciens pv. flaccumfaciens]MCS6585166.1 hypothetical protein [Curtobacterium flaccumfaciens pv. flaccumfaciens]